MCMVCVNAPRAHISAQSSFMPVRVERRRRMREGCFVQRCSGVTCCLGWRGGGDLCQHRADFRKARKKGGGDRQERR